MPASGLRPEENPTTSDELVCVELKKQSPMLDSTKNMAKHGDHAPGIYRDISRQTMDVSTKTR